MSWQWFRSIIDRFIDYITRRRPLLFVLALLLTVGGLEIISGQFITELVFAILQRFDFVAARPDPVSPAYGLVLVIIAVGIGVYVHQYPRRPASGTKDVGDLIAADMVGGDKVVGDKIVLDSGRDINQAQGHVVSIDNVAVDVHLHQHSGEEGSANYPDLQDKNGDTPAQIPEPAGEQPEIPTASTEPPVAVSTSHLPVAPEHFVGREVELEQLSDRFNNCLTDITEYDNELLNYFRNNIRDDSREKYPKSMSDQEFLQATNLIHEDQLYAAGVLLFCKSPRVLVQQAYVQCIKFLGRDRTAAQKSTILDGSIIEQIEQAATFVKSGIDQHEILVKGDPASQVEYQYPMLCLREIVANAICHRNYDDSMRHVYVRIFSHYIEVTNPGQWQTKMLEPGKIYDLSVFESEPVSKNARLADALRLINFVENAGSGIAIALKDCKDSNAPIPKVLYKDYYTIVKIFPKENWGKQSIDRSGAALVSEVASSPATQVSVAHLPVAPEHFVGRKAELKQLDAAWADSGTAVISIVAFGGVGKSALVAHWLQGLAGENYRGARRVFGHSFYSQGSRETSPVSADNFMAKALAFFGDVDPQAGGPGEKGVRLAKLVRAEKSLLILDGLESLQEPPTSGDAGRIKDPDLQALVRELAASNPGLCVISTREKVADLPGAPEIDLEQLSEVAGAALLEALGVKGTQAELEEASREVLGHGLALTLLGTYLFKVYQGDVRKRDRVVLSKADVLTGGHAKHMIEKYERWLGEGPEVAILRLLGLFDRPAEAACIDALRAAPAIPDLTAPLMDLSAADWQFALSNLQACRLIAMPETDPGEAPLDAHPVVREYFKEQLQDHFPEAARGAHRRLYEHLKEAAPKFPDTLAAMMPLYHAVAHGCAAGLQQDALHDVYHARILRGKEEFSVKKLGAFGADLAAVACFFDRPWDKVNASITEADTAWILAQTGFRLRALGRLEEAAQCMEASLNLRIAQEKWENAAIVASNLSELQMTRGAVGEALRAADQSVAFADRSKDAFQRMGRRTTLADGLHQAARHEASLAAFREAEQMQEERQPEYPLLYSVQGFQYCDLLLDMAVASPAAGRSADADAVDSCTLSPSDFLAQCHAVRKRAEKMFDWRVEGDSVLTIALDHLSLGRTHLLEAETRMAHEGRSRAEEATTLAEAEKHLDESVGLLRQAGQQDGLSRGLLARAALFRVRGRFDDAARDLAETASIADRAGMIQFQVDGALEGCRLALAQDTPDAARAALRRAKKLVKQTEAPYVPYVSDWDAWEPPAYVGVFKEGEIVGYHVHDREIARLDGVLGAGD